MSINWSISKRAPYVLLAAVVLIILGYQTLPRTKSSRHGAGTSNCFGSKEVHEARQCILDLLDTPDGTTESLWIPGINKCTKTIKDQLKIVYLENINDVKLFVPLRTQAQEQGCVGATLGVGNDTIAEGKLLKLHPSCKLYGADPIYDTGKVFDTVGTYYHLGVGGEAGMTKSLVLIEGEYRYEMMNLTTIHTFLQLTKQTSYDYFWFDCEGAEYGTLPQLMGRADVKICQMNIEFHFIEEDREKFKQSVSELLTGSPFIPLWVSCVKGNYRMFFVNTFDPWCCDRFTKK